MEQLKVLAPLGITDSWLHTFVTESNEIDPLPGPSTPGTAVYDHHLEALSYALLMAAMDRYALPHEVYKLLTRGDVVLRSHPVSLGGIDLIPPQRVKQELFYWNRRVYQTIDSLRTDDASISEAQKRAEVWGLHYELMNLRPYDRLNGKVGRILMASHAALTDAQAWVVPASSRLEYFASIRRHPSAQWGVSPTHSQAVQL